MFRGARLVTLVILLSAIIVPSFSNFLGEYANITIYYPDGSINTSSTGMPKGPEESDSSCGVEGIVSVDESDSMNCDYVYNFPNYCDKEGTWKADVTVRAWTCAESAPNSSWINDSTYDDDCTVSEEEAYMRTENTVGATLYTISYDGSESNCTCAGYTWAGTSANKCCGDDGGATDTFCDGTDGCDTGTWYTEPDNNDHVCENCSSEGTWVSGQSKCCGDDSGEDWCDGTTAGCHDESYYSDPDDDSWVCTECAESRYWVGSDCCGNDAGEDYENSGSGNSCCINGEEVTNASTDSSGQYLCVDGLTYGCNGNLGGIATESSSCDNFYEWYCDGAGTGSNQWKSLISGNQEPDDCDGAAEWDPYGEGHNTGNDTETCSDGKIYNDGNGMANQNQGWRCSTDYGPYAANCTLSQSSSNDYDSFEVYIEAADEADSGSSFGYIYRVGDYSGSDQNDYNYEGTLYFNTTSNQASGDIDSNEGTYGDYLSIPLTMADAETAITDEQTYYLEIGLEESAGTSELYHYENPESNEGSCATSATLCVPIGYSATSDSDCCPVGGTTSTYPGKDDDGGNCVECSGSTQVAGGTGDGDCESKCGADASCDEETDGTCPAQGYICSSCSYIDRDNDQSYCEDSSGCTGYDWLNSACCGDDAGEVYENAGSGNSCCIGGSVIADGSTSGAFLCRNGEIQSCNSPSTYSIDSDYETGGEVADYFCESGGWTGTSTLDHDSNMPACTDGGNIWFGGASEEGCCESGDEFIFDEVIQDQLVAYWKFDEGSGATYVNDSLSGQVGEIENGGTITTASSNTVEGNAISLDGTNDRVLVPDGEDLRLDQNMTLAFWVKPDNVGMARLNPIYKSYGGEFAFTIEQDGRLSYYHGTQESGGYYWGWSAFEAGNITNSSWQFIALTRQMNNLQVKSYLNGELRGTTTFSSDPNKMPSVSDHDMQIGDGYVSPMGGYIDEVMIWNRTLSEEEVAIVYRSFSEDSQTDVGLYLPLDGDLSDSSPYGNSGTVYNAVWESGRAGQCLAFDGDGDYASISDSESLSPRDEVSVAGWFKYNETGKNVGLVWKNSYNYLIYTGEGGLVKFNVWDTGGSSSSASFSESNINIGEWHFIVGVFNGSRSALYLDGELTGSIGNAISGIRDQAGDLIIGKRGDDVSDNYFNGSIDEVRIFNRSLTTGEIEYLYRIEQWRKYGCNDSATVQCYAGDECSKPLEEGGISYYCYDEYFTDYRELFDSCQDICTGQGGSWEGGGGDKNCCISSSEQWCYEQAGVDKLCDEGAAYWCDYWCDTRGTGCTSDADGDCTANETCGDSTCNCFRSEGSTCSDDDDCSNGYCAGYARNATADETLGDMLSALESGITGETICCPYAGCPFDQDNDGDVDSCAVNTSRSIDADGDGDLDYCYQGAWRECPGYEADNNKSSDCKCLGAGIVVNKSGGVCRLPPVDFTYDSDLSCGVWCDSDSDTGNLETLDGNGNCITPQAACGQVLEDAYWTGNDSSIQVYAKTNCPCGESASCTVNVTSTRQRGISSMSAPSGIWTSTTLDPNFDYGNNNITLTCSCSQISVTCDQVFPAIVRSTASLVASDCVAGKNCDISINVTNRGNVDTNTTVTLEASSGGTLYTNSDSVYINNDTYHAFTFTNSQNCGWQDATWDMGQGYKNLFYAGTVELEEPTYPYEINKTGKLVQCQTASDCTICCSGQAWCWLNSSESDDFTCSDGVCCGANEHFQRGACCISSERCCLDDDGCGSGEWCDNHTAGFPEGDFFCRDKKALGSTCTDNRECDSEYCGDGICANSDPVSLSDWYECESENQEYCNYSSTGAGGFDPKGCNTDGDCSSGFYCYSPHRVCLQCASPNTVYGSLNISDDGLCPSTSCISNDLDCCSSDSDCSSEEWCDASSSCSACSTFSDGVCSSDNCLGTDPDCCLTDDDCSEGLSCVNNACTGNLGETCSSDGDCTGGLTCQGGVCAKDEFISLSPQETIYDATLGETLKLTLIISDPQNQQDSYEVSVDQSYVPDSAYVNIDGEKSEVFELGEGEVRKFLVTVAAAKVTESSPDIYSVLRVESRTTPSIADSEEVQVDVAMVTSGNVPAAPTGAWMWVLILGYILGLVTRG